MPDEEYKPTHTLVDLLVGLRARGLTWAQIETETEIDAERAATLVQEYLTSNYGASTVAEQRMLQLRRLEQIANALWDQVMAGDRITEGKQAQGVGLLRGGSPRPQAGEHRCRWRKARGVTLEQILAICESQRIEGQPVQRAIGHDGEACRARIENGKRRLDERTAQCACDARRIGAAFDERTKAADTLSKRVDGQYACLDATALDDEHRDGCTTHGEKLEERDAIVRQ